MSVSEGNSIKTKEDKERHTETSDNENSGFFGVGHFKCEREKVSPQVQENERGERRRTGERRGGGLNGQRGLKGKQFRKRIRSRLLDGIKRKERKKKEKNKK